MGKGIIPGFYPQSDPPARGALGHPCHGQREQCRFRGHPGSLGGLMRLWWCRWWWRVSRGGEGFVFPLLIWVLRAEIRLWILHFVQLPVSIPILTGTTFAHCLALITTDLIDNLFFFRMKGLTNLLRFICFCWRHFYLQGENQQQQKNCFWAHVLKSHVWLRS